MKKIVAILVSLIILVIIYSKIDLSRLYSVFKGSNLFWLIASQMMIIPPLFFSSWRLKIMAPKNVSMSLWLAIKLVLSAAVLNMVLPSKMGEVAKAAFMRDKNDSHTSMGLPLVIFEKTCDVLALVAWCVLGLALLPKDNWIIIPLTLGSLLILIVGVLLLASKRFASFFLNMCIKWGPGFIEKYCIKLRDAWALMHDYFWQRKKRLFTIVLMSLFIWFLHLVQIWLFIVVLHGKCDFVTSIGLTALSCFAGLLPLTFAGMGTRDAALIFFYRPYLTKEVSAALGIMCTCRYIFPAIGGLPFFAQFLSVIKKKR